MQPNRLLKLLLALKSDIQRMLNKISTICSSVFLIIAFMTPGHADEHFPFLAEISKDSVNLRAGPNTNFEKIDKLNKGVQVVVLGRSYEWYKVQPLSTTKAYIRSDYLKVKEGEDVAEVLGDNVNIRASANSNAASLGEVKKGTLVKIFEQAKGWCRLAPVAGTVAWIHQDFLKEVSADVPSSLLIQTVQWPSEAVFKDIPKDIPKEVSKDVSQEVSKEVIEKVSLQGKLQEIVPAPSEDVHYEVVIDDKTVYYLKDIPQMSIFVNKVIAVEGTVLPDPSKKFIYPLVHVNKIALVL